MIYRIKELKGDTIPVPQLIFSKLGIAEEYNVRVALYVLATGVTDPEKICADLKLRSRISAESALSFWAGAGLLERYDENAAPGAEPSAPAPMTWAEIAAASRTDPMISSLIDCAQTGFARPLTHSEMEKLVNLYVQEGFAPETVMLCVAYVASRGKRTMAAVLHELKVWRAEGVETGEQADAHLKLLALRQTREQYVASLLGIPDSELTLGGRNAGRIEQVHGGVSRNVAEDIANVELRPTFVGLVDDTGMGQDVIDKLDNHKVNTRYIQKVPDGMGTWLAIFDNDGDVHAAISKRPDTTPLTTLLEEKGDEIFKDCDAIAIELDLEKDTVKQVLRYARKYNKKVFAAVSNMSIAMERRDYLQQIDCFVCNQQEAGLLFSDDYEHLTPSQMAQVLARNVHSANMPSMVVTMGGQGAVYAKHTGECGVVPAKKVDVIDTTGAGDAFFAGTVIGLTYGKNLAQSCEIGSRLAASVICITENVCPRFRPLEFGLDVPVVD